MKRPRSDDVLTFVVVWLSRLVAGAAFCAIWWGLTELLRLYLSLWPSLLLGLAGAALVMRFFVVIGFRDLELGCISLLLLILALILAPVFIREREKATRTKTRATGKHSVLPRQAEPL